MNYCKFSPISRFVTDERGAVTSDWVLITAMIVGVGIAALSVATEGVGASTSGFTEVMASEDVAFRNRNFGKSPSEVARGTELESGSQKWAERRMDRLMSIEEEKVQRQHRVWSARAADPSYGNPARARDQVKLTEIAMDAREISPHP